MKSAPREHKSVVFAPQPEIRHIAPRARPPRSTLNMDEKCFTTLDSDHVTDEMLEEASKLFSENYGVWSEQAAQLVGKFAKAGSRIRLSKEKLRNEYLPNGISSYVRVTVNGSLAGNAFACRWTANGKTICWVTQLVVHRDYRERGLATGLLQQFKHSGNDAYGIMSSHPAACLAAAKVFGVALNLISLEFMKENAEPIMKESPVRYIRDAKLCGRLFNPDDTSGLVCSADTGFHVDHGEPLEALESVRESMEWPLGELVDGHEFVVIVQAKRRSQSKSSSSCGSGSS